MAETREPRGPSMAYAMTTGVGRGWSIDGSSVISSTQVGAGRGAILQEARAMNEERKRVEMANAQRPYEQYLVIVRPQSYSIKEHKI